MKIDGADFWHENKHMLRMWDEIFHTNSLPIRISQHVRAGKIFTLSFMTEDNQFLKLLERQVNRKHHCDMIVSVFNPQSKLEMYQVKLKIVLKEIKTADYTVDEIGLMQLELDYLCIAAEDITIYDKQRIREI